MGGGEIFVPKIPSYRILDLVKAINPAATVDLVGIRPGEKLHEEMITSSDSPNTLDLGHYYAILPPANQVASENYLETRNASRVPLGFNYSSGENENFLTVDEIRNLIRANIDSEFDVS